MSTTFRSTILALALATTLGGCADRVATHGNLVKNDRLSEVKVGTSNREEVAVVLGTPTAISTFDANTWYYIGEVTRRTAFFRPEPVERRVLTVKFDEEGVLRSVEEKTLDDGNAVQLVERATPTPGRDLSVIQQLVGNVGRFSPAPSAPRRPTIPGREGLGR
ncbi:MAG TPA: outer membrane protein assembly factor BamE [Azospirillaceae bacterium]|nr:outer membrane protein assembly factor BamE [Azospirillaceae bacterium]